MAILVNRSVCNKVRGRFLGPYMPATYYKIIGLVCFVCVSIAAITQPASLREKIYMHFDKNEYVQGDTIWFKTYIVEALSQKPSVRSGIYYVELINQQKDLARRIHYHTVLGSGFGQIPTDTAFFEPGLYKIRAYTRWMQNFGDSLFYEKDIVINDVNVRNKWFLNMAPPVFNGDSVMASFAFTDEEHQPQASRSVAFELMSGKRITLLKDKLQLDDKGSIAVRFKLPAEYQSQPLRLKVGDAANRKTTYIHIPVQFKKPDIDLQFLPEGGHLVAGLLNKVGFKAIDQNGAGIDFTAIVKDNEGVEIANIQPLHRGMGFFEFTPLPGKTYKVVLSSGREFLLPAVRNDGVLLRVENRIGEDKVLIYIQENQPVESRYRIAVNTREYDIHKAIVSLRKGQAMLAIPRAAFPSGIATIVLSDLRGALLCQRQIFIDNKEALQIEMVPSALTYARRDSAILKFRVKNKEGAPVIGSFSLAVTDDGQVGKDFFSDENILTYLLIQSDLRGIVESPNYYFTYKSDTVAKALDALMLTQGFVRYSWDSAKFEFKPEPEYTISGRVLNYFNQKKGMPNYGVSLYTYHGARFRLKTMADKDGRFMFKSIPQFDTAKFYLSAKADTIEYKLGDKIPAKRFKVSIDLDKPRYAPVGDIKFQRFYNRQFNIDSNVFNIVSGRKVKYISDDPTMMEEVIVKSNIIKGSKNLNGAGDADQIITEEEVKSADSDMDIFDFLKKYVKGYVGPTTHRPMEFGRGDDLQNVIRQNFLGSLKDPRNLLYIFIDGQMVEDPFLKVNIDFRKLKPKDIKGMELITAPKKTMPYNRVVRNLFNDGTIFPSGARDYKKMLELKAPEYYYLEITTQSGGGMGLVADSRNPGIDEVQTPVFHYGKSSYVPKYTAENKNDLKPDYRSTIYWEPTVVTDKKGEATVSFYTADTPGTYTISLQGAALSGDIGVKSAKIIVQ